MGAVGAPAEGTPWPRLWWVPTGPLAFLPLHAAGDQAGRAVVDRVISSYLPTVRSLPAATDLIATASAGPVATGAAVRDALARHSWVHFACHAVSSTTDAAAAQLLLYDHRDDPLTIRDMAALKISRGELAYLSACDTAHGPIALADEAVHLAGTFHMAGYTHVIGTMWSLADRVAAEVARIVYEDITTPGPDAGQTAQALHHATREVRAMHPDSPAYWASYIHVGP
jgi:CHAT domain-containing protein